MYAAAINKESDLNAYFKSNPAESPERNIADHLRTVAQTFVQAQQRRIDADYNLTKDIDETDMFTQLETVAAAFKSWNLIRGEASAQAFLLSMLSTKDRREKKFAPPKRRKPHTKRPIADNPQMT